MGLLDKLKNKQKTNDGVLGKEYNEEEIKIAKEEFLKIHERNNETIKILSEQHEVNLDYSIESINELMKLIHSAREAFIRKEISEQFIKNLIVILGIYLGDTILKNGLSEKGYKWMVIEEIKNEKIRKLLIGSTYPFLYANEAFTTPIDKVEKYWFNGDIDNLSTYCEFIIKYD